MSEENKALARKFLRMMELGDVVTHYTWRGTHQAELFGVPATGRQVSWTITTTFKIADGKIREAWLNWDQWGLMHQLGVVPAPGG